MTDNYGIEESTRKFADTVQHEAANAVEGASATLRAKADKASDRIQTAASTAAGELRGLRDHVAVAVKDQPLTSLLVVGGLGLILGFLARR